MEEDSTRQLLFGVSSKLKAIQEIDELFAIKQEVLLKIEREMNCFIDYICLFRAALFAENDLFIDGNLRYPVSSFYVEKLQSCTEWRVLALRYVKNLFGKWSFEDNDIIKMLVLTEDERNFFNNNEEFRTNIKNKIRTAEGFSRLALQILEIDLIFYSNRFQKAKVLQKELAKMFHKINHYSQYIILTDYWDEQIAEWEVRLKKIQSQADFQKCKENFYKKSDAIDSGLNPELQVYKNASYLIRYGLDPFQPNASYQETVIVIKFLIVTKLLNDEEILLMYRNFKKQSDNLKDRLNLLKEILESIKGFNDFLHDRLCDLTVKAETENTIETVRFVLNSIEKTLNETPLTIAAGFDNVLKEDKRNIEVKKVELYNILSKMIRLYGTHYKKINRVMEEIIKAFEREVSRIPNRSMKKINVLRIILDNFDCMFSAYDPSKKYEQRIKTMIEKIDLAVPVNIQMSNNPTKYEKSFDELPVHFS